MTVIGTATHDQLLALKREGFSPKQAHDALIAEAKRRYPEVGTIVIVNTDDGCKIVAVPETGRDN